MILVGNCSAEMRWQLRLLHAVLMVRLARNAPARIKKEVAAVIHRLDQTQVVMSTKLKTTAGTTDYRKNQIDLHVRLMDGNTEEIEKTYAHEIGHLVAFYLFREVGHGKSWLVAMHYLESNAERCHTMDVSAFRRQPEMREAA